MDRRTFLKMIRTAAVVVAVAPSTPIVFMPPTTRIAEPNRRYFLPPAGGWFSQFGPGPLPPGATFRLDPDSLSVLRYASRMRAFQIAPGGHMPVFPGDTITITGIYDPTLRQLFEQSGS